MKLLLSHISYLLGEHRSVPVVGLGTFVRFEQPASFAASGLSCPQSRIDFVNEIDPHADRILEASIARALQKPLNEVSAIVDEQVAMLTKALYSGSEVAVDGVGILSYNDGVIKLTAAQSCGWSAMNWYGNLNVEPLVQEEVAQPAVSTAERETFLRSLSRTASSAAAVAVLILITFITSQLPGHKESNDATFATFGVEKTSIAPSDALIPRPAATIPTVVLVVNTPADGVIDVEAKEPKPAFIDTDPYVLVVASLANNREVERFLDAHPGENLGLITSNERLRVFAATGQTIADLQKSATDNGLYNRYPNAWICRR